MKFAAVRRGDALVFISVQHGAAGRHGPLANGHGSAGHLLDRLIAAPANPVTERNE